MTDAATRRPRLRLLLPEGWVRIPLDERAPQAVSAIVARVVAGVDRTRRDLVRVTLRRRLDAAVTVASERGVYELWMPVAPTAGVSIPASVAVAALPHPPSPGRPLLETLLSFSAGAPGAIAVEIGGVLGIRIVVDQPEQLDDAGEIAAPPTRLVSYVVSPAHGSEDWLVFSASIMIPEAEDSAALLAALEFVIDSMMATVTFEEAA
jgi:hypothetical protein